MRIVLDLQACQAGSRFRGIGRYSWSLGKELAIQATNRGHDVWVLLNDNFPQQSFEILNTLKKIISPDRFLMIKVPTQCAGNSPSNQWRLRAAELIREYAIATIKPDFVHVSTLLSDGWTDDAVASVGSLKVYVPVALTHYDLIPLVMSEQHLPEGAYRDYYMQKLEYVKRADLLLAISDYTRKEAIEWLGKKETEVINISSAVDRDFGQCIQIEPSLINILLKYNLREDFLLYAPGGFDYRKNINRLLEAYSKLPQKLRQKHQLVIASKLDEGQREAWIWKAKSFGLTESEFILTDYVSDQDLISLYKTCYAYVFPSLHEGFGLPILEAMMCGAAVIASNCTSIPEAIGMEEALFDPYSVSSIMRKLVMVLTDQDFYCRLKMHSENHPANFTWEQCARTALDAIETKYDEIKSRGILDYSLEELPSYEDLLNMMNEINCLSIPTSSDIQLFRQCFDAVSRDKQC